MNIGDKVRLLHSNDEGRIVGFKDKNLVEIEIEDGFVVPALKSDVVIISREEKEYFGGKTSEIEIKTQPVKKDKNSLTGVFLGFIPINENDVSLYVFNFTERDVLYNISEHHGDNSKSLSNGVTHAGNNSFVTYFKLNQFEKWPSLLAQIIFINHRIDAATPVLENSIKLKAKSFFNAKRIIPNVEKEGYLIEIKAQTRAAIDTNELKANFYENKTNPPSATPSQQRKNIQLTVDLHLDKIHGKPEGVGPEEFLNLQLKTFEKELDNAIATGADSIKFIHGIGNGTLRLKIHKHLSQNKNIRYFEDADKGKFGFGATLVHL